MRKKVLSVLLCATLVAGIAVGCGIQIIFREILC